MSQKSFPANTNFPFFLAPMVGLSHIALRLLVRRYMPRDAHTLWPTEMLNSRRLVAQRLGATPETLLGPGESGLVPQILGNEERFIAESAAKIEKWGAVGIDMNMGCPVKKALKHNYGVALMGDPEYAAEVVRMAVRNTSLPVSVKIRAGLQKDMQALYRFVEGLEKAGASWICLHPRTAEQKRRGNADWGQIRELKKHTSLPIIGNGDVQVAKNALQMKEETLCDGVMIGRALTVRPWLVWQLGEELGFSAPESYEGRKAPRGPEEEAYEFGEALKLFIDLCEEYFSEQQALKKVRFYLRVSHPWLNFGHRLQSLAHKFKTLPEIKEQVALFFDKPGLSLSSHTELRY